MGLGIAYGDADAGAAVDHLDADRRVGDVGADSDSLPGTEPGVSDRVGHELADQQADDVVLVGAQRESTQLGARRPGGGHVGCRVRPT
jgi:hypothetical protein